MSTDNTQQHKVAATSSFNLKNVLLVLGIVAVSILIALTVQAWYVLMLADRAQQEESVAMSETMQQPERVSEHDSVSVSLEEKMAVLESIDAANPTSTLSTTDKKRILQQLETGMSAGRIIQDTDVSP